MRTSLIFITLVSAFAYICGEPFDEEYVPNAGPSLAQQAESARMKLRPRPVVVVSGDSELRSKRVEIRTEGRIELLNAVLANATAPDRPVVVQPSQNVRKPRTRVAVRKVAPSGKAEVAKPAIARSAATTSGNRVTRDTGDAVRPVANAKRTWGEGNKPVVKPIDWMAFGDERLRAHRDNGLLAALADRDEPFLIEQYRRHDEYLQEKADRRTDDLKAKQRLAARRNSVRNGAQTVGTRPSGKSVRAAKARQQASARKKYAAYSGRSKKKFGFSGGANGFTLNW